MLEGNLAKSKKDLEAADKANEATQKRIEKAQEQLAEGTKKSEEHRTEIRKVELDMAEFHNTRGERTLGREQTMFTVHADVWQQALPSADMQAANQSMATLNAIYQRNASVSDDAATATINEDDYGSEMDAEDDSVLQFVSAAVQSSLDTEADAAFADFVSGFKGDICDGDKAKIKSNIKDVGLRQVKRSLGVDANGKCKTVGRTGKKIRPGLVLKGFAGSSSLPLKPTGIPSTA